MEYFYVSVYQQMLYEWSNIFGVNNARNLDVSLLTNMKPYQLLIGAGALAASVIQASAAITTYTDAGAFSVAVGPNITKEDFTDTDHFPISTGVLNQFTDLPGIGIAPGDIEPGATYSTPIGTSFFFNIDAGGGYAGGFLDGFYGGDPDRELTVTFDSPAAGFGFVYNSLMGDDFDVVIKFTSGPDYVGNFAAGGGVDLRFIGFSSSSADIASVVIDGNGDGTFAFALDDFCFTSDGTTPVPETSATWLMLSLGLAGLGMLRHGRGSAARA